MNAEDPRTQTRRDSFADEQIEVRRYLEALRRSRFLMAFIVLALTGAVLGLSLLLPDKYRATATVVMEDRGMSFGSTDAESTRRELITSQKLLATPRVLDRAINRIGGESRSSLEEKVESSVDEDANIINVVATDTDPRSAAAIANAVADAFLTERRSTGRRQLRRDRESLMRELNRLRKSKDTKTQIEAIQERIRDLGVQEADVGTDLQLAQEAEVPTAAISPRPLRNTVLAFFAALFLAVLVALGRDRLVPRISDSRELSRLIGLPILAAIPYVRRRFRTRLSLPVGAEDEAYQTLCTSIKFDLPPTQQQIVLITSAVHSEGKSTVTAKLGRALARAGHKTLLISADMRWPELQNIFEVSQDPGLAEILASLHGGRQNNIFALSKNIRPAIPPSDAGGDSSRSGVSANLHLLTAGKRPDDLTPLMSSEVLKAFFEQVRQLDYNYVLVDSSPLIGIADSQVLAHEADLVLIVARLDRLSLDNVIDMRDLLDRLGIEQLGLVVVGARGERSPYYMADHAPILKGKQDSDS